MPDCDEAGHPALDEEEGMQPADAAVPVEPGGRNGGQDVDQQEGKARKRPSGVDDLTLGKMLTEAYRGQVDYFVQGGVSVSQMSSSAGPIDQGNLMEKWTIDQV